jgi:hypothetical protein
MTNHRQEHHRERQNSLGKIGADSGRHSQIVIHGHRSLRACDERRGTEKTRQPSGN